MFKQFDSLPDDPVELRAVSQLLAAEVKSQASMIEKLKHQLAGHNRHRFGSTSESLNQLGLAFAEDEQIAEAAAQKPPPADDEASDKPTLENGGNHGRKPLPPHLERREEVLSPDDNCTSCGGSLKTLGEELPRNWNMSRAVLWSTNSFAPHGVFVLPGNSTGSINIAPD